MSGIREKFRKRYLGQMGWAAGDPDLAAGEPIVQSTADQMENQQTQQNAVYDKVYSPGKKPTPRGRTRGI